MVEYLDMKTLPATIRMARGDFNAISEDETGQKSIYQFEHENTREGETAFVYDDDGVFEGVAFVIGFVCVVERIRHREPWMRSREWRAKMVDDGIYRGRKSDVTP
ncbi:hypothetical protein [Oceanicella sp. SM1341]|uniref:hypothetical protein n=1 Tax=Oceanicella sp. SM1341 TaxID=1548889 RepID=UPI000E49EB34|nr:hypothetical protein [Oceanicella sp. SM1341]